jgi:hypothetical protein
VKAARGTWPPFGNAADEGIGPPLKEFAEELALEPLEDPVADKLALAADNELDGP